MTIVIKVSFCIVLYFTAVMLPSYSSTQTLDRQVLSFEELDNENDNFLVGGGDTDAANTGETDESSSLLNTSSPNESEEDSEADNISLYPSSLSPILKANTSPAVKKEGTSNSSNDASNSLTSPLIITQNNSPISISNNRSTDIPTLATITIPVVNTVNFNASTLIPNISSVNISESTSITYNNSSSNSTNKTTSSSPPLDEKEDENEVVEEEEGEASVTKPISSFRPSKQPSSSFIDNKAKSSLKPTTAISNNNSSQNEFDNTSESNNTTNATIIDEFPLENTTSSSSPSSTPIVIPVSKLLLSYKPSLSTLSSTSLSPGEVDESEPIELLVPPTIQPTVNNNKPTKPIIVITSTSTPSLTPITSNEITEEPEAEIPEKNHTVTTTPIIEPTIRPTTATSTITIPTIEIIPTTPTTPDTTVNEPLESSIPPTINSDTDGNVNVNEPVVDEEPTHPHKQPKHKKKSTHKPTLTPTFAADTITVDQPPSSSSEYGEGKGEDNSKESGTGNDKDTATNEVSTTPSSSSTTQPPQPEIPIIIQSSPSFSPILNKINTPDSDSESDTPAFHNTYDYFYVGVIVVLFLSLCCFISWVSGNFIVIYISNYLYSDSSNNTTTAVDGHSYSVLPTTEITTTSSSGGFGASNIHTNIDVDDDEEDENNNDSFVTVSNMKNNSNNSAIKIDKAKKNIEMARFARMAGRDTTATTNSILNPSSSAAVQISSSTATATKPSPGTLKIAGVKSITLNNTNTNTGTNNINKSSASSSSLNTAKHSQLSKTSTHHDSSSTAGTVHVEKIKVLDKSDMEWQNDW